MPLIQLLPQTIDRAVNCSPAVLVRQVSEKSFCLVVADKSSALAGSAGSFGSFLPTTAGLAGVGITTTLS
jgi:hypothetical protein